MGLVIRECSQSPGGYSSTRTPCENLPHCASPYNPPDHFVTHPFPDIFLAAAPSFQPDLLHIRLFQPIHPSIQSPADSSIHPLSIHLPTCHSSTHPFIHLSTYPLIHLSTHSSTLLSTHPPIYPPTYSPIFHLPTHQPNHSSICLIINPPIQPFIQLGFRNEQII